MEGERFFLEYGACWRNFGGEVGRYIVDGCGQFAQDAQGSTNCEACGCDKSFHLTLTVTLTHINIHDSNGIGGRAPQPSHSQESVITEVENNVTTPLVDDDYDEVSCAEKSTDSSGSKKKKKKKNIT
ncbi:hypothetical protein Acr_25g0001540 [Actinidia rufa]|uniref:ZF-HD dimerization-type domain-containing protein n=1 Tax=Actinidia rufa TaxID=165716 RepID=A0A7J0GY34_9ERIC|nr:hypothetical protein Acr_25g0001540 [Actinidia rufa]